ncbi:hypothetical protein [Roseateles sp. L2-2]|uniref:hypothetical protein n=1 Tax=Roseateles sp. L2-2 TaxID=3422597 RepID=UPI003D361718
MSTLDRWATRACASALLGLLLALAPAHGQSTTAAAVQDDQRRAQAIYLLKNDAEFFDEVVRRLEDSEHQAIFKTAKVTSPDVPTEASLKAGNEALRLKQRKLKEMPSGEFDMLLAPALVLLDARRAECARKRPVIHSIGWSPTFTFESAQTARAPDTGPRAVRIPVEGYDLDPPCIAIDVTIEGTIPVSRYGASTNGPAKPDFYLTLPSEEQKDGLNIILLEPFIDRLQTGDKVAIKVIAVNKYAPLVAEGSREEPRRKSIARRVFVAYESQAFRNQVLRSRIQPDDINAFPLPENDASALFGPLIARNYFVVRVSVRNTEAEAKIISTGMIRASGTAMIDPKVGGEPSFSVPVSVVPHSLQQIYSVLTDEEVEQPRHITFRTLEFIGALAAGAQGAFNFGAQAAKNIALFTGIIVPEGKRLWPDRWPGYQRNVVNYAMQDLVKVPANSVLDHKFLFFSKKELDGLVSDPNLFKPMTTSDQIVGTLLSGDRRSRSKPDAFVIALAFDTLDIRFETMPVPSEQSSREILRDLVSQVPEQIQQLEASASWVGSTPAKFGGYTPSESGTLIADLTAIAARVPAESDTDLAKTVKNAKTLLTIARGVEPKSSSSALSTDLYAVSAKSGLTGLRKAKVRINELLQRVNGGIDAELMKDDINGLRSVIVSSKDLLSFYLAVGSALHELASTIGKVKTAALVTTTRTADQTRLLQDFNTSVEATIAELDAKRPAQATLQVSPK